MSDAQVHRPARTRRWYPAPPMSFAEPGRLSGRGRWLGICFFCRCGASSHRYELSHGVKLVRNTCADRTPAPDATHRSQLVQRQTLCRPGLGQLRPIRHGLLCARYWHSLSRTTSPCPFDHDITRQVPIRRKEAISAALWEQRPDSSVPERMALLTREDAQQPAFPSQEHL